MIIIYFTWSTIVCDLHCRFGTNQDITFSIYPGLGADKLVSPFELNAIFGNGKEKKRKWREDEKPDCCTLESNLEPSR